MPYKNRIKVFVEDSYYHIYARGVNKMPIFKTNSDYLFLLELFNRYLSPSYSNVYINAEGQKKIEPNKSLYKKIKLQQYCLLNNHFHLLVKNVEQNAITEFMRCLLSSYVRYFNTKYNRQGPLIQGGYRAIYINSDSQLLNTGIYIHLNPLKHSVVKNIENYRYSSYNQYFGYKNPYKWLKVNSYIKKNTNYKTMQSYITTDLFTKGDSYLP